MTQAAARKCKLTFLWASAGRPSEPAGLHLDSFEFNSDLGVFEVEVIQSKVSKMKKMILLPSVDRHLDVYLALSDYLSLHPNRKPYSDGDTCWLFTDLHDLKCPSSRMTDYVKALQGEAGGGAKEYHAVSPPGMPLGLTANGVRPGVINLLARKMPMEFVTATTGQSITGITSMGEYLDIGRRHVRSRRAPAS